MLVFLELGAHTERVLEPDTALICFPVFHEAISNSEVGSLTFLEEARRDSSAGQELCVDLAVWGQQQGMANPCLLTTNVPTFHSSVRLMCQEVVFWTEWGNMLLFFYEFIYFYFSI